MANDDDNLVKTSLRLPRALHAEIEKAADAAGISTNAEMLLRLARDPHVDTAAQVIEHIRETESHAVDAMVRQMKALWSALDRANVTLDHVAAAMAQVRPGTDAAALKGEVEFARELINALAAHR
jgi:glucose-6-phosphate-specific signal transduction histidine kinase